jgi:hypothetical protein
VGCDAMQLCSRKTFDDASPVQLFLYSQGNTDLLGLTSIAHEFNIFNGES